MLDRHSWEQHTTQLPVIGQSGRFDHDCGDGRVLKVAHAANGYTAWCFRCGEAGFIPHPAPSLSERLAALERSRNAEVRASSSVALPEPGLYNPQVGWPLIARVWLYKAGLSNDDIIRLGAYWHEPTQRVILPVYNNGELVYWQGRDPAWKRGSPRIKYINPPVDKTKLCAKYGSGPVIVLAEDILSAFRVSRVTEAWALLGTALAPGVLADLLQQARPVVTMFDPDAGGQKATTNITKRLRTLGVSVHEARVPRDPKYLTTQELTQCLNSTIPTLPCSVVPPSWLASYQQWS